MLLCIGHLSQLQAAPLNLFQSSSSKVENSDSDSNNDSDSDDSSSDDSDDEKATQRAPKLTADSSGEDVNAFRNRLQIKVKGSKVPAPIVEFHEAALPPETLAVVLRNIEASDWKEPTPIQMQAIPVLTGGRDLLASAPTVRVPSCCRCCCRCCWGSSAVHLHVCCRTNPIPVLCCVVLCLCHPYVLLCTHAGIRKDCCFCHPCSRSPVQWQQQQWQQQQWQRHQGVTPGAHPRAGRADPPRDGAPQCRATLPPRAGQEESRDQQRSGRAGE